MASRSDVWQYFDKTSSKIVTCVQSSWCTTEAQQTFRTTSFAFTEISTDLLGRKPLNKPWRPWHRSAQKLQVKSKTTNKIISDLLMLWRWTYIVRPLATVEGEGMCHLLLYLEPGYHIPSYKHIAKLLQKKHEKAMAILKNKLAHDAVAMSLISDIWTSNVMESYCPLQPISSRLAGKSRVVCWQLNHSQSATWDKILQITSSNLPGVLT